MPSCGRRGADRLDEIGRNLVSIGGCGSSASGDLSIVGSNPTDGPLIMQLNHSPIYSMPDDIRGTLNASAA
jgi:hypothetical protein